MMEYWSTGYTANPNSPSLQYSITPVLSRHPLGHQVISWKLRICDKMLSIMEGFPLAKRPY